MKAFIRSFSLIEWHSLLGRVQLSLPILVLLGLAGITYFLVQQTSVQNPSNPPLEAGKPDFFAINLYLLSYGRTNRAIFTASQAQHFLSENAYSLQDMRAIIWQEAKLTIHASSDAALINQDGSEIKMIGAAQLEQKKPNISPMHLVGESLHLFLDEQRITSNQAVVFTQGENRISADQMDYDQNSESLQLQNRVRASLYPKK